MKRWTWTSTLRRLRISWWRNRYGVPAELRQRGPETPQPKTEKTFLRTLLLIIITCILYSIVYTFGIKTNTSSMKRRKIHALMRPLTWLRGTMSELNTWGYKQELRLDNHSSTVIFTSGREMSGLMIPWGGRHFSACKFVEEIFMSFNSLLMQFGL